MKSKTAFMYGPHDLRIEEVEVPALAPDQILIQVGACGICQSDVECLEGESNEGRYDIAPYTPGHEWGGKVVDMGKDVKGFKAGDKVTGDCVMGCGYCRNCKDGLMPSACLNFREIGFRPDSPGGMGEYMVVEQKYVHKIPDDWTYEDGAWVETFSIGYFGIWGNGGHIDASDVALITGVGPVGLSATMTAATSGAIVIVSDPIESRREKALKYGATYVVDPTQPGWIEKVWELSDGRGPSVITECSGNHQAIADLFDVGGHSARIKLVGHSIGHKLPIEIGKTIWRTFNISGAGGTKDFGQRTIRFMSRIRDKYDFAALNTHYYPFEKLHEAFKMAAENKIEAMKVMLKFDID